MSLRKIKNNKQNMLSRRANYSRSSKTYTNPFFESSRKHKNKIKKELVIPLKVKIITSIIIFFIFFIFWFCFYSGYFTIKAIEARGGKGIQPETIESIAWRQIKDSDFILWQQKNIFIFNKDKLIRTLNLKYSFNDIIVSKNLPNKLIIDYDEKEYSFMWLEKGIYYYTDLYGYIVDRIGGVADDKNYPLIENKSSHFIDSNKVSINPNIIKYVPILVEKINVYQNLPIDRFIIDDDESSIKVQIKNGPKLFFNINGDIDKQLKKIIILKNEILKEDFYKKEYIDVRIGERLYYR